MLLLAGGALAQASPPPVDALAEQRWNARLAELLFGFARQAQRDQVGPAAKRAFDEIVCHYAPGHAGARKALGQRQTVAGWKPSGSPPEFRDGATDEQRVRIARQWRALAVRLAGLHRARAAELRPNAPQRAMAHLERAIALDPLDEAAHRLLGHGSVAIGGTTYHGSAAELAFIANLRRIEQRALALARQPIRVDRVVELPRELTVSGLPFHGARSVHFKVFTRGTAVQAEDCARWAERALVLLTELLGEQRAARLAVADRQVRYWDWQAFVWTERERDALVAANLQRNAESPLAKHLAGQRAQLEAHTFSNISWNAGDKLCEIGVELTPAAMHDRLIASCWEIGIGVVFDKGEKTPNFALTEGALHAATWLLKSTAMSKRGTLPEGTAAAREVELPRAIGWWRRTVREQALAGTDMPLRDVARQTAARFPNAARLKAWSFMTWLMARHPESWYELLITVPGDKVPFPEEVEKAVQKVLGRPLDDVEREWRAWASGRSVAALATGFGPPVLPEQPSREQRAGLARLNEVRTRAGLPPCVLDQEASLGCVDHARYLAAHPEQWTWPALHEQDPAKSGFSARGMRCGQRSVIVVQARGAAASVDGWMGTVYHRFPLLAPNVRRVGFALVDGMCVLDLGSLEEPHRYDRAGQPLGPQWVVWPPDRSADVPRQFAFYELPNPLGDQPPPKDRDDRAGYPVSLTLAHHVHPRLSSAGIRMFALRGRGAKQARGDEVRLFVHTPAAPLLRRMVAADAVFGIPEQPLEARTSYEVEVRLRLRGAEDHTVAWRFTTGSAPLRRPGR
ncbi:MAG: hypothetical protein H6836_03075 [Planctomycetes bacterium]|nr:hypothetical protein [Planctomycetota bacterium]